MPPLDARHHVRTRRRAEEIELIFPRYAYRRPEEELGPQNPCKAERQSIAACAVLCLNKRAVWRRSATAGFESEFCVITLAPTPERPHSWVRH